MLPVNAKRRCEQFHIQAVTPFTALPTEVAQGSRAAGAIPGSAFRNALEHMLKLWNGLGVFLINRVLSAGVRERPWRHPVPSSALLIGPGETRWRDEL